jgi:glutaredoxin
MLKLYDYPDCPYGQKVRVVLAEKELEYETALVDLRKQEQRTPEFLRLNPLGKVPVLVDEDARRRIAEAGERPAPVGLVAVGGALDRGDVLAMRPQTRAARAADDVAMQPGEAHPRAAASASACSCAW